MSDEQAWPTRAVVDRVAAGFRGARDELREKAHAAFGDENAEVRQLWLDAIFVLDAWRDRTLAALGEPTPVDAHPELADEPPGEWPLVNPVRDTWPVSPANRTRNDASWTWKPQPGMHRSSP